MTELEKRLAEEKKRQNDVKAPVELEGRLRMALEKVPERKPKTAPKWIAVIAAIVFLSVVSYNYNAFAYYGKMLLGFDDIMTGTLSDLNDAGLGQTIDATVLLEDGSQLQLEGMYSDKSQFVLYYTYSNPDGVDLNPPYSFWNITGVLTKSFAVSGTWSMNDEETKLTGMQSFDAVSPFAKSLTLHLLEEVDEGQAMKEHEISFPFNPNEAMVTEWKQSIKKTVQVDQGTIRFDAITATPSRTTVTGKLNVDNYDRYPGAFEGIQLLADGKPIDNQGAGVSSSWKGSTFNLNFDALPEGVKSLELVVQTFVGYMDVDATVPLTGLNEDPTLIHEKELFVRKVEMTEKGIQVTIATADDVLLEGVSIQAGERSVPLKTLLRQDHTDDYKERILLFESDEMPDTLHIEGMHYKKNYGDSIKINVK
ncbi:DUF4179 domain-containing protein [Sporosarcina sp. Sa2YVA2]|uniref:DUF4179 domain-containing protein n=1 Tax=Sporosarcina quadrami TaxID=2762234 RepID=A0ABR8U7Z4_9BACL|nr:DUF4179 domain-containing protein [Sporosarcina quadrami]MBD7984153.1 DUF4179 domain-containing protein [Sporosarcina quadrami]